MNKTISTHLGGSVFNIEEEAYSRLETYLQNIRHNFHGDASQEEIMQDIESRIAELFQTKMVAGRHAIILKDVEEVITTMGQPEDYGGSATDTHEEQSSATDPNTATGNAHRRVYRDKEDALVAGVCSGLSHYIKWDPVLVRLLAAVLIFFSGGVGVIIYVLLWASIPAAATTAEKLQMRGESVNVDNIARFINDEARAAAENLRKAGDRFQQRKGSGYEIVSTFGKVMRKLVGALMVLGGIALVFALIGLLIASESTSFGGTSWNEFRDFVFPHDDTVWLAVAGVILMLAAPAIGFLYAGFRLVIGNARRIPGLGLVLIVTFVIGIAMAATGGLKLGSRFAEESSLETVLSLDSGSIQTLTVSVTDDTMFKGRNDSHNDFLELMQRTDSGTWLGNAVHLQFEPTVEKHFRVEIVRQSSGASLYEATSLAEGIRYQYTLIDSTLELHSTLFIPQGTYYRGQCANITVFVPIGHYVYFGDNIGYVYWNREMKNRYRRMTRDGWDEEFDNTGGLVPVMTADHCTGNTTSLLLM
jgi:phage shock protein PspC (stress-responsive transcriptional regulator)